MKIVTKSLIVGASLMLPVVAFAQSNDAKYCEALTSKYQQYAGAREQQHRGQMLDATIGTAIAKCKAGDTATGIPVLEKALKDAKVDLPSRT
jgi:hypothetical protein